MTIKNLMIAILFLTMKTRSRLTLVMTAKILKVAILYWIKENRSPLTLALTEKVFTAAIVYLIRKNKVHWIPFQPTQLWCFVQCFYKNLIRLVLLSKMQRVSAIKKHLQAEIVFKSMSQRSRRLLFPERVQTHIFIFNASASISRA